MDIAATASVTSAKTMTLIFTTQINLNFVDINSAFFLSFLLLLVVVVFDTRKASVMRGIAETGTILMTKIYIYLKNLQR